MHSKFSTSMIVMSAISLMVLTETATSAGMFDWMSPNRWFNNRDYDRDYHNRGYSYPYAQPGWGGYGYPAWGGYHGTIAYPAWGYPAYGYPVQPQQNTTPSAPAPLPIPQ